MATILLTFHIRGCQLESRGFTPHSGGLHQSHIRGCQLQPGGLHPPRGVWIKVYQHLYGDSFSSQSLALVLTTKPEQPRDRTHQHKPTQNSVPYSKWLEWTARSRLKRNQYRAQPESKTESSTVSLFNDCCIHCVQKKVSPLKILLTTCALHNYIFTHTASCFSFW